MILHNFLSAERLAAVRSSVEARMVEEGERSGWEQEAHFASKVRCRPKGLRAVASNPAACWTARIYKACRFYGYRWCWQATWGPHVRHPACSWIPNSRRTAP
jgi:hypothetical protein